MSEPEPKKRGLLSKVFRSKDHTDRKRGEDSNNNNKDENGSPQPPAQAPIDYHSYGLKCVVEGKNPTVDIVAVHGLNGHREHTWKAENGVNWLMDENMLPKRIPNARIFVWGYDARTHGNDYLSQAYLHQHGTQLVGDLADERHLDGTSKRPLIFIGHSLGGIVIKSALIHSNSTHSGHLAHHRPIKISTYGIFFMGTPHSGGQGVTMGQIAQNVASIFIHTNDNVLQHLQQQSEWLTRQKDDYAPIMKDFVTKFGWEVFATPLFGGLSSIVVVPQWSAIGWQGNAEPVQIMANHITMVKFRGEDDPEYNKVWKKLAIMAQEAGENIKKNWMVEEGSQTVANAILNKHNSEAMLIEVITRLTEKPAVGSDSKPDDENYLTTGALDVLYDQNNDAYEAKSDITLIETVRIEETDRMRKYQIRLLKAVEQYELEVGSKDIKVSTGISLTSQHNWNDVLGEAEVVREKYISQEGSNSISTIGDGLSTYELAPSKVEQWLALLPSAAPCASRLCGGLRIVFAIIWRSGILYNETYSALSEIPVIIANAQDLSPRYDQPTLAGHVEQLYCAVISMLGHILLEYCRASTGPHVRFSHGFELMHRYKKLIQPEQEVVINQRVRVQTLNFLKSMRNKLWDRIFTVLNEELAKTQHDQELEGIYEDMKKTRETSVNAQLYKALKYDHLLPHLDMRVTMRQGFHFSAAEKSRMSWLVENESLRDWITSPTSDLFLINGNEVRHEFTSPVSVYCGMLTRALQSQPPRVVLYWYCGLHLRETVAGVLGNLIGQLLYYIEADKSSLKSNQKVWYAGLIPDDPESLFRLFATILKHQLKLVSVFCILDGISFYEDGYRGKELIELIAALEALISEAQESKGIFKVLLTSPTRSRTVREEKITDLNSTEVLNMPRFIMMGRRPRGDFEALRDISRRSSISSVGSAVSEYYDAPEYLDD